MSIARYLVAVGSALSQLGNAVLLGGHPNESISGRSYRCRWWSEAWIDGVLGRGHCRAAFLSDAAWAESYSAAVTRRESAENSEKTP
jgi:hypothetical protein